MRRSRPHSVASAVLPHPPDSTPTVAAVFDHINAVSSAALRRAPLVDLRFDEQTRLAFHAARVAADAAAAAEAEEEFRTRVARGIGRTRVHRITVGELTISDDIVISDDVAHLKPSEEEAADPLLSDGGALMRVALPNGHAPLKAFDADVEVLFYRTSSAAELAIIADAEASGAAVRPGGGLPSSTAPSAHTT